MVLWGDGPFGLPLVGVLRAAERYAFLGKSLIVPNAVYFCTVASSDVLCVGSYDRHA